MSTDKATPSPETHRYLGMWRPPWDDLWLKFARDRNEMIDSADSAPYFVVVEGHFTEGRKAYNAIEDVDRFRADYLAGHFDVPQYTPITPKPTPKPHYYWIIGRKDNSADGPHPVASPCGTNYRTYLFPQTAAAEMKTELTDAERPYHEPQRVSIVLAPFEAKE